MAENPFARLFNRPASSTSTTTTSSVRLGVVAAGQQNEPLRIGLTTADVADTKYDCISYDRSKDVGSIEVEVEGKATSIPTTLKKALKNFRQLDRPSTLWADLLIGNTVEDRSTQAEEMKSAFEHAETVLIWLGPDTGRHKAAFDLLQNLANRWHQARLHANFPQYHNRATQQQMMGAFNFLKSKPKEDLNLSDERLWKTVGELFDSPYFQTTQSIAEVVLAKKAVVVAGDNKISWEDFNAALAAYLMLLPAHGITPSPTFMEAHQRISRLDLATLRKKNGESLEFLAMLKDARRTSFTDPREIVFSLLPIITPCERTKGNPLRPAAFKADYSKTTTQVLKEACKYIVEDRQDVILWSFGERPPCGKKVAGLPSWAPDLSSPLPINTTYTTPSPNNGLRAWADPFDHKQIFVDPDDGLHVQAHVLDRIFEVSTAFTEENCRRLCLQTWQKVRPEGSATTDGALLDKVFRTLVLNTGAGMLGTDPPHDSLATSFYSLIAEERILELLNCTMSELGQQPPNPDIVARGAANPEVQNLRWHCGKSQDFETLLKKNAIGRRFFQTESGNFGMTAIETPAEPPATPMPNFDAALSDPFAQHMLTAFQAHVAQRDPRMAGILSQAINGTMPGQKAPGVRSGDLVVAVVGGYSPYVLRPVRESAGDEVSLNADAKYTFVGDAYLHGVMDGECFKEKTWMGLAERYRRDIEMVDVIIV